MKLLKLIFIFCLLPYLPNAQINTAKPWAYWWWMGSAVNEKDISRNLQDFANAGFGGMHIIPIYGVKGEEANFIPYLSSKWVEMLDFTVKEAQRLGLGIDMTLGTGWPFGGSYVSQEDAAKSFKINSVGTPAEKDGKKYVLDVLPTKQKVKRAAPGGEGWVLDHFNKEAVKRYFQPFDSIFSKKNIGVRAFYNDSYEVYGANWTTNFFEKFKILRGYDLSENLDVLAKDTAKTDREKRIWADYHETLSDIMLDDFTKPLAGFTHKFNKILRNESHGSPANILDLYAASDVPESEFFGSKPYNITGYKQDEDYDIRRFGKPGELVLKLASSAAHLTGKKLVSSETATWLGNHFKVSLKQVKPIIDESFIGGINHIFYHGVPYSPPSAPFPGWLFYASTNFNQQSHFWNALPQLNGYIERCQTLLQNSQPDNDILLYFPLVDTWHSVGKKDRTHALDVHTLLRDGFLTKSFGDVVFELQNKGYAFDFVSDRQLQNNFKFQISNFIGSHSKLRNPILKYKTVIVPPTQYMPLATLKALDSLKKIGLNIIFVKQLPKSVNGFFEVEKRQAEFDKILNSFKTQNPKLKTQNTTTPSVFNTLSQAFENQSVRRETMREKGLQYIRKRTDTSTLYFISNFDTLFKNGTIRLESSGESVRLFNPLFQTKQYVFSSKGVPTGKKSNKNSIEIPLELASGESIFVEIFNKKQVTNKLVKALNLRPIIPSEMPLKGTWKVEFIKGEPSLPKGFSTEKLESWTKLSTDTMAQYFSGTVRYTLHFNVLDNEIGKAGWIDLGDVRESATVKLNGKSLGTAWCLPFKLPFTAPSESLREGSLKKENVLEIDVTNLSINRIRYLDKQGVKWQKFYDINMVDINYRPFDASGWQPVASGLLGGVKLVF